MTITNETEKTKTAPLPAGTEITTTIAGMSEIDQLKAQLVEKDADLLEISIAALKAIPDGLKALIPDELTPAQQVKWFHKAQGAGLLVKPQVPQTDTTKPNLLAPKVNTDELPPIARMSYGYN